MIPAKSHDFKLNLIILWIMPINNYEINVNSCKGKCFEVSKRVL